MQITDANGSIAVASLNIVEPSASVVTSIISPAAHLFSCDGSVTLSISGSSAEYDVFWSNGANGLAISNICAGDYSVDVIDENGCCLNTKVSVPTSILNVGIIK